MTQHLRPTATFSNSGWTIVGAASAHEAVDEPVDSNDGDASYIEAASSGAVIRFDLTLPAEEIPHRFGHSVRVAAAKIAPTGADRMLVQLQEGATVRAGKAFAVQDGGVYRNYILHLSEAEAAAIGNYPNLVVAIEGNPVSVGNAIHVTAVDVRLPSPDVGRSKTWSATAGSESLGRARGGAR